MVSIARRAGRWGLRGAAVGLLLGGCTNKDVDEPVEELPTGPIPKLPLSCPDGTPEAGVAGGSGRDSFAVSWTWDEEQAFAWSGPFYLQLADDITGLAVTADGGEFKTAFGLLTVDGRTVVDWTGRTHWDDRRVRAAPGDSAVDSWGTGDTGLGGTDLAGFYLLPFVHGPVLTATVALPMNADTRPTAGCLAVVPISQEPEIMGTEGAVHVVTKRSPPSARRLDVNLVVVEGSGLTERGIDLAMARMAEVYTGGGALEIGEVRRYDVTLPEGPYLWANGLNMHALRATPTEGSSEHALNFYFIADFVRGGGTLGISSGVPGPIGVPGTAGSGVVLSVESHLLESGRLDSGTLGETMAHEAGHQLGLFHTTESGGDGFDVIDDTPECHANQNDDNEDGEVTVDECLDADGTNFMFWVSGGLDQDGLTPQQADMLVRSAIAQ